MNLFYREIAPSEEFSRIILSFWEFKTADEDFGSIEHEIFPDGCISLFYHRNLRFNFAMLAFSGLHLEMIPVSVSPSDIYWGMRISPASCANVLRENPAKYKNEKLIKAEDFSHLTEGLLEKLNACDNFDEAVGAMENHLKTLDFRGKFYDKKIAQAIEIIEETSGEIKISQLAEKLNLSLRQLERRFKKSSGLSPKQFARTRRIRATAVHLVENVNTNWASRAAEMGFTDQAHLSHEFVSVTKRSPNSFAEKVKEVEHGNLI